MSGQAVPIVSLGPAVRESWVPAMAIALGQALMSFNAASLLVAIGGIIETFNVQPTTVATAIAMYSLSVAGLVMLGAKLNQRFGALRVFRIAVLTFGSAMVLMTFSPTATVMIAAQGLAGAAGAVLIPSLVALAANNYLGPRRATALGAIGAARAGAAVAAFLIGGVLGTFIGWRPAFGILIGLAAIVFVLSLRLKPDHSRPDVRIDVVGVVLAATAIILISLGFDNLSRWGLGLARHGTPFDILGLSPAPGMIVIGVVIGHIFLVWSRRRQAENKTPLLAAQVIASPAQRSAVFAAFAIVTLKAGLNFSVPLYIQIVQGRTPLDTAIAMTPFNLSVTVSALLIVRFYDRMSPRQIARVAFALAATALIWLALVVHNDWSTYSLLIGLIIFGLSHGSLMTLLLNVLVTSSPSGLAGDVGSLCGTTNNLAVAVGTALAGVLTVSILSVIITGNFAESQLIPLGLKMQAGLDDINFVSDARLLRGLERTKATAAQVEEVLRINSEARLSALKITYLVMAGGALLAILPAGRLPTKARGNVRVA